MTADALLSAGMTQCWQATATILIVGALTLAFCRRRPHLAYALWTLALLKCLMPPIWSSSAGVYSWMATVSRAAPAIVAAERPLPREASMRPMLARDASTAFTDAMPTSVESNAHKSSPRLSFSMDEALLTLWLAGTGAALAFHLARAAKLRGRLGRMCDAVPERVAATLARLHGELGLRRPIPLRIASDAIGPGLFGVIHPLIVLPQQLVDEASPRRLEMILAHELLHARRKDHLIAFLQAIAHAVWWFHPLVWWMNRHIERARELACDEEVLATLRCPPEDYTQMLLDVLKKLRCAPAVFAFQPAMRPLHVTMQRLRHLMTSERPFAARTPRTVWAVMAALAILLLPGATLKLRSQTAPSVAAAATAPATQPGETLRFEGVIVDKVTQKPVPHATVIIHRLHRPAGGKQDDLAKFAPSETITADGEGKYSVSVPPVQYADDSMWLATDMARAPGYAPSIWDGSGVSLMVRKNKEGDKTFGMRVEIQPAEEVTGIIKDFNGVALSHIPFKFYTQEQGIDHPSFQEGETDDHGRYRVWAIKGGRQNALFAYPKDFASLEVFIGKNRGDLGTLIARPGAKVTGTVLDSAGKPVPHVSISAAHLYETKSYVGAQQEYPTRETTTDDDGHFTLDPMDFGRYELSVHGFTLEDAGGNVRTRLPGYYCPVHITLAYEMDPVEIRPVATVHIHIQTIDPAGKPLPALRAMFFGKIGQQTLFPDMVISEGGLIDIDAPKGLQETQMLLDRGMLDEKTIARFRFGKNGAIHNDRLIDLGTLSTDIPDLYLIRYPLALLRLHLLNPAGGAVLKAIPHIAYADRSLKTQAVEYSNGTTGISLNESIAGTWTSEQVLPNEPLVVTINAPGYKAFSQDMTLKEGETRDVDAHMTAEQK